MKKTFIITYKIFDNKNNIIKSGSMKCKNKYTDLEAKISLEAFLKKKYNNFYKLVVVSCKEDYMFSNINDIFSNFSDIFKK
jgi:hypothetical protein